MLSAINSNIRVMSFKFSKLHGQHHHLLYPTTTFFTTKTHMDDHLPPKTLLSPSSSPKESDSDETTATISLQEWQAWGTTSLLPAIVSEIVEDLKDLERETNAQMSFGGNGGKIKGVLKIKEDKKHRAKYQSLSDCEQKIQFFSARQIACRLLGSRGYLCQKCWLPLEDCMCSRIRHFSLWQGIRFWVYMHPKDFLRQNNTGKLLWQVLGVQAASLCVFGIVEHEEIMWNEFMNAGKNKVWCLYPSKNAAPNSVKDIFNQDSSIGPELTPKMTSKDEIMHFILIDGTWSNSAAMFRRLKERANLVWGEDLPCISLTMGASAMHKLRPQPSWDRTCTAAAAVGLLLELQSFPELSSFGLVEQGEAVEDALEILLASLTARRLRKGRSITRKVRHNRDIC